VLSAAGALTLSALLAGCSADRSRVAARTATTGPATTAPTTTSPAPSAVDLLGAAGTCTLTPATIAGPTWFDAQAVRSDVRDGKAGIGLMLAFRVVGGAACTPLANAVVDLWQADAGGVYSGFLGAGPGQGGAPGGQDRYGQPESKATDPSRALRGTQATSADGIVQFTTVYPGWYPTRTPHLHLEVHVDAATVLTTQLFFDDAVSDSVFAGTAAYQGHGTRDTRNDTDAFYAPQAQLRLTPRTPSRWLGALTLAVP
jgi:protocatechuate 3,4-dioxygenase beta subunit